MPEPVTYLMGGVFVNLRIKKCFKAKKKRGCEACALSENMNDDVLGCWGEGAIAVPCACAFGEGRVGRAAAEHM